jgi:hypothetical protein
MLPSGSIVAVIPAGRWSAIEYLVDASDMFATMLVLEIAFCRMIPLAGSVATRIVANKI